MEIMFQGTHKLWPGGLIAIVAVSLTLGLFFSGALNTLENISYDWRMKLLRSERAAHGGVAVILVDEASLSAMNPLVGRWPWPRSVQADVIDFLSLGNPRAIVFDILFSESESAIAAEPAVNDQRLISATAKAGNVIHAMQLYRDNEDEINSSLLNRPLPQPVLRHAIAHGVENDGGNNVYSLPLPGLLQASLGVGVVTAMPDDDGIYRRSRLWHDYQGYRFPGLSTAPLWLTDKLAKAPDSDAEMLVNYYGHIDSYSMSGILASVQKLLEGEVDSLIIDPHEFENKIVFVGASAVGLEDLKTTPLAPNIPGVMINAAVAANLLSGDLLRQAPVVVTVASIIFAALAVCLLVIYPITFPLRIAAPLLCAVLYITVCFFALKHNYVLALAPPLSAIVLASVFSLSYLTFTEGRDKRRVRTMLAQYVSPAVLNRVIDRYQDYLQAEVGTEEELSILFSDIRGFTGLSETIAADKVVEILNYYFSAMTEAIFEQRGTIDKFIGDAIMAFWGAPVRELQHADLAVRAAIEMHRRLGQVNLWLQARDYPPIQIGVGINSGKVILGSIGSVQKLDYTIIGDNVNLASRLEGLTKQYGVTIVISEYTYNQLREPMPCLILELVQVKGKRVPIRIYSPILDVEPQEAAAQARLCQEAFSAYLRQDWARALELYGQLPAVVLRSTFIERCLAYQRQPPPADWNGVFIMTTK